MSKFDAPAWIDKSGNIVEEENEAFRLKSSFYLDRPDMLLFVDEVVSSKSQANDGNIWGEKPMCISGGRPQERANAKKMLTLLC